MEGEIAKEGTADTALASAIESARAAIDAEHARRTKADSEKSKRLAAEAEDLLWRDDVAAAKTRFEEAADAAPNGGFHLARAGVLALETGSEIDARTMLDRAAVLLEAETGEQPRVFDPRREPWDGWFPEWALSGRRVVFRNLVLSPDRRLGGAHYGVVRQHDLDETGRFLIQRGGSKLEIVDIRDHGVAPFAEIPGDVSWISAAKGVVVVTSYHATHRVTVFDAASKTEKTTYESKSYRHEAVDTSAGLRIVPTEASKNYVVRDAGGGEVFKAAPTGSVTIDHARGRIVIPASAGGGPKGRKILEVYDLAAGKRLASVDGEAHDIGFSGDDIILSSRDGVRRFRIGPNGPGPIERLWNERAPGPLEVKDGVIGFLGLGDAPPHRLVERGGKWIVEVADPCVPERRDTLEVRSCNGGWTAAGRGPKPLVLGPTRQSIRGVAISSDGKRIAIDTGVVTVWDLTTGEAHVLGASRAGWSGATVAFAGDGRLALIGAGAIEIWDASLRTKTTIETTGIVRSVALSPSGKLAAATVYEGNDPNETQIRLFDVDRRELIRATGTFEVAAGEDLAFGQDETTLLGPATEACAAVPFVGSEFFPDPAMCLYDVPSLRGRRGYGGPFTIGAIAQNGAILGGSMYEPTKGAPIRIDTGMEPFRGAAAGPTGDLFAAMSIMGDDLAVVIDPTRKKYASLDGAYAAFDPLGRFVVTGGHQGVLSFYVDTPEPALRLIPVAAGAGAVDTADGVQIIGTVPDEALFCRAGHYVLPFEACRGHLVDPNAVEHALDGAKLALPMGDWPPPPD